MILKDKTILVTGTSSGIGLATAKYCLEQGAKVYANVVEESLIVPTSKVLTGDVHFLPYDVSDSAAAIQAFNRIKEESGQLHGLVNNAGILVEGSFLETELEQVDRLMQVNVRAAFHHAQLAIAAMLPFKQGSIVNLCSYVGEHGAALYTAYSMTKGALGSMTKSLAREFGEEGLRINAVAPGFIESNMTHQYQGEVRDALNMQVSMRRPGSAEEVAKSIGFLLSDQSSYVSGSLLGVDGAATF